MLCCSGCCCFGWSGTYLSAPKAGAERQKPAPTAPLPRSDVDLPSAEEETYDIPPTGRKPMKLFHGLKMEPGRFGVNGTASPTALTSGAGAGACAPIGFNTGSRQGQKTPAFFPDP